MSENVSAVLPLAPWAEFLRGLRAALPVMLGFIPFGLVLGAQAAAKGFSFLAVPLMCGLNYGGGSEFAAVKMWTFPPDVLVIAGITFLINSRHLLMGAILAPYVSHLPRRKVLPALALMCDECWALNLADARKGQGRLNMCFYLGVGISLWLTWVLSATLGAIIGPVIGDLGRYGFDMAFPAVFFVMLAGMWRGPKAARPWLISLIVAAAVYHFMPGPWYVPVGALCGVASAWFLAAPEAK